MQMLSRASSVPIVVLSAFLFAWPAGAGAQTVTGSAQGTVKDSSGGVLPGVTVTVRNADTGLERSIVTDTVGFYSAPFLPIGRYRFSAELIGFSLSTRERVDVQLNQTTVVDFMLAPGGVTEAVSVTAESPRINTTNSEIKGSLTADQILDKPTLSPGSFLSLAEIFAGFQENPTSGQNNPTASSGSSINFNGTGTRGTTFQINGVNNDDSSENQNRQGAALSTIQEFVVIKNSFTAEFGRGYGAVVLVQTKAGTNALHGDAYEYHQDSGLNAKSFFSSSQPKPVNRRNQYGFTAGFPLVSRRLFAFISADRTERSGANNYARDLFLPNELAAPRLTRGNDTPENRAFIESVLARYPASLAPNDRRSVRTFAGQVSFDQPDRDYSGRLDFHPSAANQISARQQYTRQIRASTDVILGEQARQNNRQQNVGVTWTRVFSSRTVGELRYGLGIRSTHVDIAAGNDTPIIRFNQSPVASATIGNAGQFPINRDQRDHQFVYNLSWMWARNHMLKMGTDIRRQGLDDFADSNSRGFWSFSATCGGVIYPTSYAAFLDGCVSSFTKAWAPFLLENRINEYNVYSEDNWKVTPSLTLNLGLRYEYVAAPYDIKDRIAYGFGDDRDNVEPRLGFAYSPGWTSGALAWMTGGPGNASVRGGYGIYHGRIFQSVFSQSGASLRTNPPNALSRSFTTQPGILNVSDPTLGFVFVPGPQASRHTETLADPNLEMPSTHQWNLTMERKVRWDSTVRLSYVGTRGTGLIKYTLDNLPVSPLAGGIVVVDHPNNAPAAGFPDLRGKKIDRFAADIFCAGTGLPNIGMTPACPNPVPIADNEVSFRVPRTNERRPDPRFSTLLLVSNGADSWYNGLQTEWIKRLSAGLQFQFSYTWSKAIDTTSEATDPGTGDSNQQGPLRSFARGLSRFDTRHRLTLNGSYVLPFLRGRRDLAGNIFGGWQISGVLKVASGTPFTVRDSGGIDLNFDGFAESRPVLLDPSVLYTAIDDPNRSTEQLPRSAFRRASLTEDVGTIVGRNTFFTDGVRNVDLGIYKTFRMPAGGHLLTLRIEGYNVFNRVQFGFPNPDFANVNFGRILSTSNQNTPRIIQVAVRYRF